MAEVEQNSSAAGGRRRRRRRRRNRRNSTENGASRPAPGENQARNRRSWRSRDEQTPVVNLPSTGRVPRWRLPDHPSRAAPKGGATGRRRRTSRADMDALAAYLLEMPEPLLHNLYSGMGGQPNRVSGKDRIIQLSVRAIAQGNRLGNLVKTLHQRDRQALAILVQAGGIAQNEELYQELTLSLGGNEREWTKVMVHLCDKGLVAASEERNGIFFYLIPDPLVPHLIDSLPEDLSLPHFDNEEVRVADARPFQPPFDFSLVTLATYIDQHPPRLTQRHEIFKVHKDEMDKFFSQVWSPDSELFSFHIEFLMTHGMVELRGDRLAVNRGVIEEWLQLDTEDQRDLVFTSLERHQPQAEWVLWAIHDVGGAWVPERPLQAIYRRWRRGQEWRERFRKDAWATPRTAQREGYNFGPLVNTGMVELGHWGQEKFYRLTPRGQRLLSNEEDEGFSQFYLTPNFELMAPAGLAPILFFRLGELAELTACDRANTYKITEVSIEQALEKGWRRDDILEFLRDNSQIGLPDNVDQTLRGWMGHHGDVEFHDVMLLTVHRSQIRRLESHRQLKPYLLHRFVPGMYAVDRSRMPELAALLAEVGFNPALKVRKYPDDPQQVEARERLLGMVTEAREARSFSLAEAHAADTAPDTLELVPGAGRGKGKSRKKKRDSLPTRRSPREVRDVCEQAIADGQDLEMLYVTRDQKRKLLVVRPERLAINQKGQTVLVARDLAKDARLSYQLVQIERVDAKKASKRK